MKTPFRKMIRVDNYDKIALIAIVLATVVRLFLLARGWPETNSDEGTMGLMARHIAYRGEHPLIFYGQDYMGTLEAYLAAVFFHLLGPSVFTLRLSVIVLFALFLLSVYLLVCLLYNKPLALFSLLLLGVGSVEVLFRQLEAVGGSPEVLLFGTGVLLLASWLALSRRDTSAPSSQDIVPACLETSRRYSFISCFSGRALAYGAWGVLAGLAIWSDPLVLPFVGMACLLLALCCRQELKSPLLVLLLLGVVVGLAPEIIYKATVPPSPNTLALLGPGYHEPTYASPPGSTSSISPTASLHPSWGLQFEGAILISLPLATSANSFCSLSPNQGWPVRADASTLLCISIHGVWGIAYIMLWCCAVLLALQFFWCYWHQRPKTMGTLEERQEVTRQTARLMLLGSAGGTLVLYMLFPQAALTPWSSSRYLVGVLISLPAILFPLWRGIGSRKPVALWWKRGVQICRYMTLLFVFMICLAGTVTTVQQAPQVQAINQQQDSLVEYLLQRGATRIYTDYWTCDRLAFQSDERIICSVLDNGLQPGLDRYQPYQSLVKADPHPFYVFPLGSPQDMRFAQQIATLKMQCQHVIFAHYAIYHPEQSITYSR